MSCLRFISIAAIALAACGDDDKKTDAAPDASGLDTRDASELDTPDPDAVSDATDTPDGETVTEPDQDGDGLSDAEEAALGTDPTLTDSDADGYWDGWEAAAASDPNDPLSTPALDVPDGAPYILDLVDIIEPTLLRTFLSSILDRWPPILLFADASAGPGTVTLKGGIAKRTALGPDDTAGTTDDEFSLELGSLDPATGAFQVLLDGTRTGNQVVATAPEVVIDLSNISEIVRGVRLRVEDVRFEATFGDGDQRLDPTRLSGILSRAGVEDILENADLPLPIDASTAMEILDPDGDGIIAVDIALEGRPAIASGWVLTPDAEPEARDPGTCCPAGLAVGDPIDAALTVVDQGLQPSEEALAKRVIANALATPELLDFVAALRVMGGERRIYVYSPRGNIYFTRNRVVIDDVPTTTYSVFLLDSVDALEGSPLKPDDDANPIGYQIATDLSDYESFLAAGEPFAPNADYESLGFAPGDERLVRVPAAKHPYPFGYERLSQIFDDPRAGDLVLEEVSYYGNRGNHGHLAALQSRSPLIVSGAGVIKSGDETGDGWSSACAGPCGDAATPFLVRDEAVPIVDVAPTIAKAVGVAKTTGVGPDGFLSDDVYLAWQDGRPLGAVLDGTTAKYAIILINDGLTSMELLHQAFDGARDLDAYRELMARGVTFRHGAITNFPSNTYPSHNVVGSGAYSGHHGLVDNSFYERPVATEFAPIAELFSTEKFVGSAHPGLPIETLHEAMLRSFGGVWNKTTNATGILTASLNDPSTRGAPLATLERRLPDGYKVPEPVDSLELNGQTFTYPEASLLDVEGLLDNSTVTNAYGLFIANPAKGFPIPRYSIINLSSTDGAGHKAGPHGDELRETVLGRTNARLRMLIEILKQAGIYDDTIIVLTADHGMELKDPNLTGRLLRDLPSDISLVHAHDFIYLKQLVLTHSALPVGGGAVTFTVSDSDGAAPLNLIGGATVIVMRGEVELARGTTEVDGTVVLDVDDDGGPLTVTILKSGFSLEDHLIE